MKSRSMKEGIKRFQWMLLAVFAICIVGCKEDKEASSAPYDPDQPMEVTDFTPKEGGAKTKLIIYGHNFGTDTSIISVKVGGKDAIVVSAMGTSIYCVIPEQCYEGTVEVKVGDQEIVMPIKYKYIPQMVVTTLCGNTNDQGEGDILDGPFDNCGKIEYPFWFSFDPQHPNILYLSQDGEARPLRVLDLKREMITKHKVVYNNVSRMRSISWTKDGNMVIACPGTIATMASNLILERGTSTDDLDFKNVAAKALTSSIACNSSMILPATGEIYFNYRAKGSVYRYNYVENGYNKNPKIPGDGANDLLFNVPDQVTDFSFVAHPGGEYVYIIMHEKHYILRANYDIETKQLVTPYIVCGKSGEAGYSDVVGTKARMNTLGQGVFVYNEEYKTAGKKDHYDFYFTDTKNHCIRILTPDGMVTTFAGRGSASANVFNYGYINGEVRQKARFNNPIALAYDEDAKAFYVGDVNNHRIRKIALEKAPDSDGEQSDEDQPIETSRKKEKITE